MKLPARLSNVKKKGGKVVLKIQERETWWQHTKGSSNPSIWEEETGGSLQAQGQPSLHKFQASQNYTATLSFKEEKKDHTHITNVDKIKEGCWEQLCSTRFVNFKGNRQNALKLLLIKTDPGRNKD